MSLVIYSSYVPNLKDSTEFVDGFLKTIEDKFKDSLICIGINTGSDPEWPKLLDDFKVKTKIDIHYKHVNPKLSLDSDTSGFQVALDLYVRDLGQPEFDGHVWFGHTKGITTDNIDYNTWTNDAFWGRREEIEEWLDSKEDIGSYGHGCSLLGGETGDYCEKVSSLWKNYNPTLTGNTMGYFYTNTFYVTKKEPFQKTFKNINNKFFDSHLNGPYDEKDRYFFERDFIHFVDISGLAPSFTELTPNNTWEPHWNPNKFQEELDKWKSGNQNSKEETTMEKENKNDSRLDVIWKDADNFKIQQKQNEWFDFLKEIMNLDKPVKLILEIGCYDGGGTVSFSHLTEELISIDQAEVPRFDQFGYPPNSPIKGSDYIKQNCKFNYVSPDSHSLAVFNKVKEILNGRELDVLFIDGDHTYGGAKQDFVLYSDLVRKGGMIALHDVLQSEFHEQHGCFVHEFWDEVKPNYDYVEYIYDYPFGSGECSEWGGIGIIKNWDKDKI